MAGQGTAHGRLAGRVPEQGEAAIRGTGQADESDRDPAKFCKPETARAHFRIGQIDRQLNKFDEAGKAYAAAIAAQERLVRRVPDNAQYRRDLANSHNYLGELHRATGHPREAG